MSVTPRVVQIPEHEFRTFTGPGVFRGTLSNQSHLEVDGDAKLGKFLECEGTVHVEVRHDPASEVHNASSTTGGTLILAEGFTLPASGSFCAEKAIQIHSFDRQPRSSAFDSLTLTAPIIHAPSFAAVSDGRQSSLYLAANSEQGERFPLPIPGTKLTIHELRGPCGNCVGFAKVRAGRIKDFPASRGWGIVTQQLTVDVIADSLIRAEQVRVGMITGALEFLPIHGDPHPTPADQMGFMKQQTSIKTQNLVQSGSPHESDYETEGFSPMLDNKEADFEEQNKSPFSPRIEVHAQVMRSRPQESVLIRGDSTDLVIDLVQLGSVDIDLKTSTIEIGSIVAHKENHSRSTIKADIITLRSLPKADILQRISFVGRVFLNDKELPGLSTKA